MIPLGDQKQPADGVWKFTLPKDSPPGVPLVMLLPVSASQSLPTSDPSKISQNILPSPLVLKASTPAPCVISMPVVSASPVLCKEAQKDIAGQSGTSIPANILIPMEDDDGTSRKKWTILEDKNSDIGKQVTDVVQEQNVTAQFDKQKSLKNEPNALTNESVKDCDSSPVMAEPKGSVPLILTAEKQSRQSSVTCSRGSSETAFDKGQLKYSSEDQKLCKETLQEVNTCDVEVEVEVDEGVEVEIGDEDSGVDMLEGELQECVTCGQFLPEKDMVQHYMKHAAVSEGPRPSPKKCASHTTDQSPSCSPSRKRQRSETEL